MYYYVNGTVAEIDAGLAVIDCSGVGYACATTNYTLSQLKKGVPAKLYTYLNVREDAMELFGFADQSELRSFKLLIGACLLAILFLCLTLRKPAVQAAPQQAG